MSGKEILEPGWRDVYAKESNNKNTDEEETDGNNSKKENDGDHNSTQGTDMALLLHKLFKGQNNEQGRHHEIEALNL